MSFIPAELIKKKREGWTHSPEEIEFLIQQFTEGTIPDYQMSSWLMAVFFQGASSLETATLTNAMRNSGSVLNFSSLHLRCIDKHSTGGVGDKTSLILGPVVASAGIPVPMIAGRGLAHTGGTLDKLESIPGFRVMMEKEDIENNVKKMNLAIVGQTHDICPADRKIYALRDVTATIESPPLICGSIMSKKLAEDLHGLVLDVKFGSGAFIKTISQARILAKLLANTGESNGVHTIALLTSMEQPLGRYVGNSLEVKECVDIMQGKTFVENGIDFYGDTRKLSLELAGHMIWVGGKASSLKEGIALATDILESGKAYDKFVELCQYQGPSQLGQLPLTDKVYDVLSSGSGYVNQIHVERLGLIALEMGAGRRFIHDKIDPVAGIEWCCKIGQKIEKGQVIARVHCEDATKAKQAVADIPKTVTLGDEVPPLQLIAEKIYGEKV